MEQRKKPLDVSDETWKRVQEVEREDNIAKVALGVLISVVTIGWGLMAGTIINLYVWN